MKTIELTRGMVALVDDDVYEWASKFKWHALKSRNTFYAARSYTTQPGKQGMSLLHREIMKPGPDQCVDHKFGDTLDNRRSEMRNVTHSQNGQAFSRTKRNKSSQFRGVGRCSRSEKWVARIRLDGKVVFLGRFSEESKAAIAYDTAALKLFGEFAQPNFPVLCGE